MRLGELVIKNFRSCVQTSLQLHNPITLLVGENDSGKSNIIDAIRMTTPSVSGTRSLWFDPTRDLSRSAVTGEDINISKRYVDLSTSEAAFYMPSLVDGNDDLVRTTTLLTATDTPRWQRMTETVGDHKVTDPEPDSRGRIAHVFLPPLRDAARELDSAAGNKLASVIELIASTDEIELFEEEANQAMEKLTSNKTATDVKQQIQKHLTSVTQPVQHRQVGIRHGTQRLRSLARALRLNLAAVGAEPADLASSGLGYANLLYLATVVLELEKAKDYDLLLLLVEEPEAHLHPQLQKVLLSYLEEQAKESIKNIEEGKPAGIIQVIATSHSPELACSLSTTNIVVVRQTTDFVSEADQDAVEDPADDLEEPEVDGDVSALTSTSTLALEDIDLTLKERRKIDRYLDSTRSALLFARQVVLVEGLSEAILIRALAEWYVFPEESDGSVPNNKQHREQFRAISVIPIGGVDFRPYVQLLLSGTVSLVDKLIVITDGDNDSAGDNRKKKLEHEFKDAVEDGMLSVHTCATTFEAELFGPIENETVLRAAYLEQHPLSAGKWDALAPGEDSDTRAARFREALKDRSLDLGKGDFAQVVLDNLMDDDDELAEFQVPAYLKDALQAILLPVAPLEEECATDAE